jgi:tellurite resistance protein
VEAEPSLIDPDLPVSYALSTGEGGRPGYEYAPAYSVLKPQSRASYLEWLADGRCAPAIPIGCVFLFFYGIERRLLVDAEHSELARAEAHILIAEVERLLEVYGRDHWFRYNARAFLTLHRLRHEIRFEDLRPPFEGYASIDLRLALGKLAAEKRPVPADWALSWLLCWQDSRLRLSAFRQREELRQLFALRYHERFPDGLRLKPGRARITFDYKTVSPGIGRSFTIHPGDLPNISNLVAPRRKLQEVADRVFQELGTFCRWVDRTGDAQSPAALSLLPRDLARLRETDQSRQFVEWLEGAVAEAVSAPIQRADLLAHWRLSRLDRVTRRDLEMLAVFLERHGYGMEPDVRFGGPVSRDGTIVLFRLPESAEEAILPSPACQAAALSLHLAAVLAAADGPVNAAEEAHLLAYLESAAWLGADDRMRLRAHLRWLIARLPGPAGLKKRIEPLSPAERRSTSRFLIGVAAADGGVNPDEIRLLSKFYTLLGFDRRTVYSDVHAQAAAGAAAAEPVTLRPARAGRSGFAIPKAPSPGSRLSLDARKISAKLAETETVSSLLDEIFTDEGETPPRPAGTFARLDAAHSALLSQLAVRSVWDREEVERLADDLGLFPDGAMETLNEAAYDICGAPLLEGDQRIEIDGEILQEVLESPL